MRSVWLWLLVALCFTSYIRAEEEEEEEELTDMEKLQRTLGTLSRQLMMQQLYQEEKTRSEGDSGVKQIRVNNIGTRPYMTNSYTGSTMLSIHDHSNNVRTVGLGEFIAVLNGVEFRTRHNDYPLKMPDPNSKKFHKTVDIPFPEVPPSVLEKETVEEQIIEMQQYFKAWAHQRKGLRDYEHYFKAVMCYLEGAWTTSSGSIDEPFESDRHHIDAKSWFDLTEKVRFTAYSGRKSNNENYAYLPMKIIDVVNDTYPILAQWNYRIVCHPLKDNLPLVRMRPIDDLGARMAYQRSMEDHVAGRGARFEIHSFTGSNSHNEFRYRRGFLDTLFEQIPGKDNYPGDLIDDAFGMYATPWVPEGDEKLNVAYYHRRYRVSENGAMGTKTRNRGFADRNVFMAMTESERIPGAALTDCTGSGDNEVCQSWHQKWSYAIPLEIVYMTPLNNWNPYNIEYKGKTNSDEGKTVTAGGRNGGFTPEKAYNGSRQNVYYRTPAAFYGNGSAEGDPADTTKGIVGVLDGNGNVQRVVASGTRVFFPEVPGVGIVRQRYPIAPLYDDGSHILKEVEALKDILLNQQTYAHMMNELPPGGGDGDIGDPDKLIEFAMGMSTSVDPPGLHQHFFEVYSSEMDEMIETGKQKTYETTTNNGHSHTLIMKYVNGKWEYTKCDTRDECWDEHSKQLTPLS